MNMLRVVPMALVLGLLSGCATTKPEMSSNTYTQAAKGYIDINYCNGQGWLESDIAAMGSISLKSIINKYTFDPDKLNKEINWIDKNQNKPTLSECRDVAMKIQEYNQRTLEQNRTDRSNQIATQEIINNTRIKNTFCNRIGTQTFCNTY